MLFREAERLRLRPFSVKGLVHYVQVDRARGATAKAIGLAEDAAVTEAELGAPLLRQMALSQAFMDLSHAHALPESTKLKVHALAQQQHAAFQRLVDMNTKKNQVSHAAMVVALKRM